MAYVNYRFQSLLEVLSGEMSMSRQENVIVKMVLLGITGHGDFCFFVVLGVFSDLRLSLSFLLSLAALWAGEALRSLPQLLRQEGAWL